MCAYLAGHATLQVVYGFKHRLFNVVLADFPNLSYKMQFICYILFSFVATQEVNMHLWS